MPRPVLRALLAALLAAGIAAPAPAGSSAAEDEARQIVDIPGTGMAVTLPVRWRVWSAVQPGRPTEVLATDVGARQICHFSLMERVASAERAAHETVEVVEAQPQLEVVERTFLTVPSGNAVRVAYGIKDAPDDAPSVLNEYYLTVPSGVVSAFCSGDEPPADRWLSVIEGVAPRPADPQPAAPFEPRVEMPAHGFAVGFPEEWLVRPWPGRGPVLGGYVVLRAVTLAAEGGSGGHECVLEDDTVLPDAPDIGSIAEWRETLVSSADMQERQTDGPVVTEVELPSGRAIRADWQRWYRDPATAWVYLGSDGRAAAALVCRSDEPPEDRWLSIAKTFEFLPVGGLSAS